MNLRGPWSNVARSYPLIVPQEMQGRVHIVQDDLDWCGHHHRTAEEAYDCPWAPDAELGAEAIYIEEDYFPIYNCPHDLHPAECERCLAVQCIHEQPVAECPRCIRYEEGDLSEVEFRGDCEEVGGTVGEGGGEGTIQDVVLDGGGLD